MQTKVSDSYKVGAGDWDAMHAFEGRVVNDKSVTVGGVHTKINAALKDFYTTKKLNPYVSSIKVTMDKNAYTVNWEVTIEESPDGVAWVGITSRGGAGPSDGDSGSIKRAFRQIVTKKKDLPSEVDKNTKTTDVYDFFYKFSSTGAVRQIFVQYTSPSSYPNLPKSGSVQNGQVGKSIPIEVGPENNGKVVFTSGVGPSNPVDNSGQTGTNPQATVSNPVDGTSIPTGGTFDFSILKDSERKEIGFISFPPRRSGSVPVVIIYPKSENLTQDETFELGKERVTGKHSGIKMAKLVNNWQNSLGQSANQNWIPDIVTAIGNQDKSPIENWFNKWCLVFANEPDTDFKSLLNLVETELDFRAMTTSSFNFVVHGNSADTTTTLFEALSGDTFVKKTKTLLLLESLPDPIWGSISKKIKSSGGQVYYVYNSQNFKIDITKTPVAGISYSTPISVTSSSVLDNNSILFFDNTPGLTQTTTVSVAKYNQTFGVTGFGVYTPFPEIPYKSLPLTQSVGLSSSVMIQSLDIPFIGETSFNYTSLAEDIFKENGFVYDLSKNPVENYKLYGGSASWPEVNLVNGLWKLNLPQPQLPVVSTPSNVGSPSNVNPVSSTPSIPEINVKYVQSHLQGPNLDFIPQLGFQIFYSDIEKNIGQSTVGVSGSVTKTLLSGQFTFDVRRKGYLINDQLGEFKIVEKVELDPFVVAKDEEVEDMSLISPEYLEGEFMGEQEIMERAINESVDEPMPPTNIDSPQVTFEPTNVDVGQTPIGPAPPAGSKLLIGSGKSFFIFNSSIGIAGHRLKSILTDLTNHLNKNGYPGAKIGSNGIMRDLKASTYTGNPDRVAGSLHGSGLAIDVTFSIPGFVWKGYKTGNPNLAKDPKLNKVIWNFVKSQGDIVWGAEWGKSKPWDGMVQGWGITEYHHFEIKSAEIAKYWKPFEKDLTAMGYDYKKLNSSNKLVPLYKALLASKGITSA
jgi:hypothetical protein